jgi:hypothetical protein
MRCRKRTALIASLLLIVGIFSTGCVSRDPVDTSWVTPIYFEQSTVDWLDARSSEWPESLERDLLKIYRHNKKVETIIK